ncbi:alpha-amylase [Streptomyces fradiae]|uniref:alpha-amylase n=1 Tax=Streptomyces fradiae TaxID=1906 RepID=UPI002942CF2F|nr:alpha-amylase [Streptomyces fradiae]WOI61294.1 alpha-amylase [Streptomyces fradiae]
MTAPATVVHAASPEAAADSTLAPACVALSASWRYTFVANDCSTTHTVRVVYGDGTEVPCREVAPGATATFPGYGTSGNTVEGVALCGEAGAA